MNYKNYLFLLPLVLLLSPSVQASQVSGLPCKPDIIVYDTSDYYILAGTYSGRRADAATQRKMDRNKKPQNETSEFSAFESGNKATTDPATRKHHYGGRRPDRHRMRH